MWKPLKQHALRIWQIFDCGNYFYLYTWQTLKKTSKFWNIYDWFEFCEPRQLMRHYGLILKGEVCHSSAPSGSKVNCSCEWWGGFDTSLIAWKSNGTQLHKSHMIWGIIQIRWKYLVRGFETLFKLEKIYATSGFRNKKIINFLHYRIDL